MILTCKMNGSGMEKEYAKIVVEIDNSIAYFPPSVDESPPHFVKVVVSAR